MNQKPKKLNYNMKNQTSPQPETHTPRKHKRGGSEKINTTRKANMTKKNILGFCWV